MEIIDDWKLPDIINQEHKLSKGQWKVIINRAAKVKNGELLAEMMSQGYSKLEIMKMKIMKKILFEGNEHVQCQGELFLKDPYVQM